MAVYTLRRSSAALNTANDFVTVIAAASRRFRLLEAKFGGMGTTSAAGEVGLHRSTGGTTGGGALTPTKMISDAPTQAFTNFTTWSAQPTLSGDPFAVLVINQNGAVDRWIALPNRSEFEVRNSEQMSARALTGTHNVSGHLHVDEL